jgi:amidohydrolase
VVRGKSGHAAHPYAAVDPIVAAAHFIAQVQTVVSREIKPLHPAVVTVGMVQGGTTYNIIPERVHLKGTVRTLHADARDTAEAPLNPRLAEGLQTTMRVRCEMTYAAQGAAAGQRRPRAGSRHRRRRAQMGVAPEEGEPSMGAEDFSEFAARAPAFQLRIGSGAPGRDDRLHNAFYQPDERCIELGVQALSRAALELLR